MKRKKRERRSVQAALCVPFLTNGDVDDIQAAGYLPILRWVKKEKLYSARPKFFTTDELRAELRALRTPQEGKR